MLFYALLKVTNFCQLHAPLLVSLLKNCACVSETYICMVLISRISVVDSVSCTQGKWDNFLRQSPYLVPIATERKQDLDQRNQLLK